MKVKSIKIEAKEWFDNINGNSYFSAEIWVNEGEKYLTVPYQYGYEDHYLDVAYNKLVKEGVLPGVELTRLPDYCQENGIFLEYAKKSTAKRVNF